MYRFTVPLVYRFTVDKSGIPKNCSVFAVYHFTVDNFEYPQFHGYLNNLAKSVS